MSTGWIVFIVLTTIFLAIAALIRTGRIKRENISLYGPFVMIKTKRGKKLIDRIATKAKFWKSYGTASTGAVYVAMTLMTLLLLWQATLVWMIPADKAPSPQMMIGLPGVNPLIPIWYGILGLAVAMVFHEFAHGILTRVAKSEVKSLGILYLIVPIGAFVEPDEEQVAALPKKKRVRMFAVGPATNIFVAIIFVLVFAWGFMGSLEPEQDGMLVIQVSDDLPADKAGIEPGMVLLNINGTAIIEDDDFFDFLGETKEGQVINITAYDDGEIRLFENITLEDRYEYTGRDDDKGKGYLGISAPTTVKGMRDTLAHPYKDQGSFGKLRNTFFYISLPFYKMTPFPEPIMDLYSIEGPLGNLPEPVFWIMANALYWMFWLNLMVGITNSLPAYPLDGGFIIKDTFDKIISRRKPDLNAEQTSELAHKYTVQLSYLVLVLILMPLFVPHLMALF